MLDAVSDPGVGDAGSSLRLRLCSLRKRQPHRPPKLSPLVSDFGATLPDSASYASPRILVPGSPCLTTVLSRSFGRLTKPYPEAFTGLSVENHCQVHFRPPHSEGRRGRLQTFCSTCCAAQ